MNEVTSDENNSELQFKFCWVIALRAEAAPLIDAFNMKTVENKSLFPIYANEEAGHALVISGMGSIKSAAAATFLKNHLKINPFKNIKSLLKYSKIISNQNFQKKNLKILTNF